MVTILSVSFHRSLACLTLDDDRKIWLTRSDLRESGWSESIAVEEEAFDDFVRLHQYPRALNQAVSLLAARPCSRGEIEQNLLRHRYTDEVVDLVLYKLEKEKLLNDREFSDLWVQQRSAKYGSRRIRMELRHKGISEGTAEEALAGLSEEKELEAAVILARKGWSKIKPGEDPRKSRQKVISSLVRKGYDWDIARQASDTAESENL